MTVGQNLVSKHRVGMTKPADTRHSPAQDATRETVAEAVSALNEIGDIVSGQCFTSPESLTRERITAYALALVRLRDASHLAGLERLVKACDALAVTVGQLIENRGAACREKCESLRRFVVHAEEIIQMSVEPAKQDARAIAALRAGSPSGALS